VRARRDALPAPRLVEGTEVRVGAVRVAFAVGAASSGCPFEVWALFTSRLEAQRHADAAAYVFEVFVLPVHDRYEETPRALRPDSWVKVTELARAAGDESVLAADALATGQAAPVDAGSVYAVGDFDSTQLPEVRLLFVREADAQRYLDVSLASGTGAQWMEVMSVYANYDACPRQVRYREAGPALSQLVRPR